MVLRPEAKVEIAFNAGYATPAASRTWTDVTAYALIIDGIDITHGRGDERSQADANSLRLTLKNSDGRFTPGLATSPYYPNVKISRPVRVTSMIPGNLILDPRANTVTNVWFPTTCTIVRTTAQAFEGAGSLEMTADGGSMVAFTPGTGTSATPVSPSKEYTASGYFRTAVTARSCTVRIDWYDAAGASISTTVGSAITDDSAAWTRASATATSPATAAFARVRYLVASAAAGEIHYVDAAMFNLGALEAFASGDTTGWEWEGAVSASVSLKPSYRFLGYIDEWPLEWPAVVDTFATSTITATSRSARLGASAPLGNHIYEEYKRDSPSIHFMLDNLADSVGGPSLRQMGSGTAVTFEGTGPTDGIQAAIFTLSGKYLATPNASAFPTTNGVTLEAFYTSTMSTNSVIIVGIKGHLKIKLNDVNSPTPPRIDLLMQDTVVLSSSTSSALNNGSLHHVAATVAADGTANLYVDGVLEDTGSIGGALSTFPSSYPALGAEEPFTVTFGGHMAHAAFYESVLAGTRLAAHANAGLTGNAGETAEARLIRYAAFAGIPTAEQSISTSADTPMAHIDTTGQTPLSLMQTVAETDGGVLYDSRDGLLTYAARSARYNAVAGVTLDASASQVGASYAPKLDRSSIINEVVATIADGSDPQETVTAKNATSYTEYGPHHDDIELATTDADEAHAAAWWRVNTYGEPTARAPQLGMEIASLSDALQDQVLALNVGSKITVTGLPSQSDAASKSFFVEGYTERIGPETHTFEFNISPTTAHELTLLLDSATRGLLDTNRLAY